MFVAPHLQGKIGLKFIAERYFPGPLKDSKNLQGKEKSVSVSLCDNQRQLRALYTSQLGTFLSSMENSGSWLS